MMQENNNYSVSDRVLKQAQIEAIMSISQLLMREISALENIQANLKSDIGNGNKISLNNEIQKFESDLIRCALIRTMGKQSEAAKLLGLKKSTLNDKIKRYNIELFEAVS